MDVGHAHGEWLGRRMDVGALESVCAVCGAVFEEVVTSRPARERGIVEVGEIDLGIGGICLVCGAERRGGGYLLVSAMDCARGLRGR